MKNIKNKKWKDNNTVGNDFGMMEQYLTRKFFKIDGIEEVLPKTV